MASEDKVNILLVDDQPAKLLSYETILAELGERLIKAASAKEALEHLLKHDIAVILVDVCMPELDGFQLAAMIREHPRFQRTAIIFISAIHLTDVDRLRAYEMGAVDYVPVPVIPEVLRAKVRIFGELYRKTRQLEQLNQELERRVAERTAELEASTARLMQSEERRSLALAAGQMGSWEWDPVNGHFVWDDGQYRIFGVDPASFVDEELAPYRADAPERIAAAGPDVSLEPRTAQTLALALHELCTNAAKYGSLSVMAGRVEVNWELQPRSLLLRWTESGGPRPHAPAAPGFGIRMISASIERQLAGEAAFHWRPEGLHCSVCVPRGDSIEPLAHRTGAHWTVGEDRSALPLQLETGNRVLLVEDEILVAMMMKDILTELGFSVIGPFSRLAEAMVAAVHDNIDAGIIDVNLGGEFVYPVADVLAAREIPFVFITGYAVESIDSRFGYVPIVKKPVQRQVLQKIFIPADSGEPAKFSQRRYGAGRLGRTASAGQS